MSNSRPNKRRSPSRAVRPIVAAKMEGDHLLITVAEATPRGPATTWDLTAAGDKLSGTATCGDEQRCFRIEL